MMHTIVVTRKFFQPALLRSLVAAKTMSMKCEGKENVVSVSKAHGFSTSTQPSFNTTTIIVGAGMSGIMAAKTLSDNGMKDFLILEASERIGGRMHKETFGGIPIELGASWVEGVGGKHENPIWTLANKYGLRMICSSDLNCISSNIYKQEGGLYSESEVAEPFAKASKSSGFCEGFSAKLKETKEPDISILTAQRMFRSVPETELEMVIDYFFHDYDTAEPPRVTSLKNVEPNSTYEHYGEDVHLVADPRGFEHIVYSLATEFLETDGNGSITDIRLKLNEVVNMIEYSEEFGVKIITENGSEYRSKNTIVSVSLGVLQSDLINFDPPLPLWKSLAIAKFDMTDYCKIFIKFPYTFWPTGPGTEFFLYAHEKRGYYSIWQHLDTQFPGCNVLMVTVTDLESKRIQQQPDYETEEEIMEVLTKMFPDKTVPIMETIIVPRWGKNRFFKGTYINWPIGAAERDFDMLKAPVGPVYFTGEHTSLYFNGYVHGAYHEGVSCARSLLGIENSRWNRIRKAFVNDKKARLSKNKSLRSKRKTPKDVME